LSFGSRIIAPETERPLRLDVIQGDDNALPGRTARHRGHGRHHARIEVATHAVADLDRRLRQIDVTIEEAAKRGKTATALSVMEGQRKARTELAGQRQREGVVLADLKAERAALVATGRRIETEAAPIRYVAELVGADTDSEKAIRWLIALMVFCCDPLAIVLTASTASARR
jgi:hypothetical protein